VFGDFTRYDPRQVRDDCRHHVDMPMAEQRRRIDVVKVRKLMHHVLPFND
jgi:hypothetical protein